MNLAEVPLSGQFFDKDGRPTTTGVSLLRTIAGLLERSGGILGHYLPLPSMTVAQLEEMNPGGFAIAGCSDEASGECLVYFAPTAEEWRRADTDAPIEAPPP